MWGGVGVGVGLLGVCRCGMWVGYIYIRSTNSNNLTLNK